MICVLALGLALGCGGTGPPSADSYCGEMPNSGGYGLFGPVVLVIGKDQRVQGTLQHGDQRYEIRGEITSQGVFVGVLDGPVNYDVSGTLLTTRSENVNVSWTINRPGAEADRVFFSLGDCS